MLRMCSCTAGAKIIAILFENILVQRTSQPSMVKWAWAFSQSVVAPTVSHLVAEVQFLYSKGPDSDRGPPVE